MGIKEYFGYGKSAGALDNVRGIASPWAGSSSLNSIVLSDVFGGVLPENMPMTRAEALTVPAVNRARNLLVSTIGRFPLIALDANGPLKAQPSFLYRTDSPVSAYDRTVHTVDDLLFYGMSLWLVERGAGGQIIRAEYCPFDAWTITNGNVLVNEQQVPEESYIFFNHISDGLLNHASKTLRGALAIESTWVSKVRNPIPLTVISSVGDQDLDQDEIDDLRRQWLVARRDPDGALGYLPSGLKMEVFGDTDPELFESGRNGVRSDIAAFTNVPVSMLDGSITESSLQYSTQSGNRNRFYEEALPYFADVIAHRLSADDCIPRGSRVRFDMSDAYALEPNPTAIPTED